LKSASAPPDKPVQQREGHGEGLLAARATAWGTRRSPAVRLPVQQREGHGESWLPVQQRGTRRRIVSCPCNSEGHGEGLLAARATAWGTRRRIVGCPCTSLSCPQTTPDNANIINNDNKSW
jgi:hypothetical protein